MDDFFLLDKEFRRSLDRSMFSNGFVTVNTFINRQEHLSTWKITINVGKNHFKIFLLKLTASGISTNSD